MLFGIFLFLFFTFSCCSHFFFFIFAFDDFRLMVFSSLFLRLSYIFRSQSINALFHSFCRCCEQLTIFYFFCFVDFFPSFSISVFRYHREDVSIHRAYHKAKTKQNKKKENEIHNLFLWVYMRAPLLFVKLLTLKCEFIAFVKSLACHCIWA